MYTAPDWSALRQEFPTLSRKTYLNTCSLGALSNPSRAAVQRFLDLWTEYGAAAWYAYWLNEIAALRGEFACLINAEADEIAVMPNIGLGLAAVSSALDWSKRRRVVACELDFPTLTHHYLAQARAGVETIILPSDDHVGVDLARFEDAVDDRTALISTSRVYFTTGYIQDVKALADIAHRRGALVLIDDYQGTGQVPIDVKAAGIDILLTGGLKWLLGGPGIAFMFIRRDLIRDMRPALAGWFGHREQFAFNPMQFVYRDDAGRFEVGTPSVPSVYAARAGLQLINDIGPERVRWRTAELAADLVRRLRARGFHLRIPADPGQHASITIVESQDPAPIVKALADRRIIVDRRPNAVRISPYFYNTPEENETIVEALAEIREAR